MGCGNQQLIADSYEFNHAMIKLTNGEIKYVDVDTYSCSDSSVLINTTEGERYGVSYVNVTFYN